ncbi:polysaccharide biosynthesis tyrosine autokinase [Nocardioides mangrovicus]|uniref:polysaccharide biosynthesis tyrosine autokinase n=1 Tax=Nocardioides mangrovicus TaxID=2478913 RepID=UPI001313E6BE|nr:polysaccharide biosynthesis tyrosine autokinase [Nocardioides mangrovicus]
MTVVDFVRLTRVNWRVIFATFSLGLVAALLYTLHQPVVYTATSKGYVAVDSGDSVSDVYSATSLAQQKLSVYVGLVSSTAVAQDVIDSLKLDETPSDIASRFSAVGDADNPQLTIYATASSPSQARDLANAVIGAMSTEAAKLESAARPSGAPVSTLVKLVATQQAGAPSAPSSPDYRINLLAGGIAGIVAGYLLALVRRQLDSRIRTVDDMESLVGTSVLTILPESDELDRVGDDGLVGSQTGPAAEALRQLRTNLRFVDVDKPPQSIVITSANAGEGKSVVTANLARVLAAAGQKTILLDGDLRRPMVSTIFELDPVVGLTQVLAGDIDLRATIQDPGLPNLDVIAAGRIPPNPSELLGSQRMQSVIEELVAADYMVLIDAPPLLPVTDAGLLSGIVDGSILVLAVGKTYKEQARLAAKVLQQVGGHVLGSVLNRAPLGGIGGVVYGYGHATHSQDYYSAYDRTGGDRSNGNTLRARFLYRRMRRREEREQAQREQTLRERTAARENEHGQPPVELTSIAGKRRSS